MSPNPTMKILMKVTLTDQATVIEILPATARAAVTMKTARVAMMKKRASRKHIGHPLSGLLQRQRSTQLTHQRWLPLQKSQEIWRPTLVPSSRQLPPRRRAWPVTHSSRPKVPPCWEVWLRLTINFLILMVLISQRSCPANKTMLLMTISVRMFQKREEKKKQ